MHTPAFEELAGDEQLFFADYFNQKPLLRRNAITCDPRDILSVDDLDELLHRDSLRLPYVSIARPESSYRKTLRIQGEAVTDCVVPERVYEHFHSGAVIQFYSVHHFFPNIRELIAALSDRFASRSDVIAFLSAAGAQSNGYHDDPVDLFIIQVEGTKSWKVWSPPDIRKGDSNYFKEGELGEPLLETDLRPGDVLYLPYNTPHLVTAKNEVSLHLSVAVRPRMWSELLVGLVQDIVDRDPAFWSFPYLSSASAGEQAAGLKSAIGTLIERLADADPDERIHQLADAGRRTEGIAARGHEFRDAASIDRTDEMALFRRGPAEVSFAGSAEGKTTLGITLTREARIDGKITPSAKPVTIKVPAEIADSISRLGQDGTVRAGEFFPGVTSQRSVEAVKSLARLGVLTAAS